MDYDVRVQLSFNVAASLYPVVYMAGQYAPAIGPITYLAKIRSECSVSSVPAVTTLHADEAVLRT